ncbi:hypothetical protein ABOM_001703 [Aspergillus bombycis]|uniref:Uncharacterized protein n=1 Tax=Aspergillus bombycis TaxID=109264 RepID=A0A1F8ACP4_9EURO|nr:hypothetical protein ABOM_001703 [Aspergillus bombycis]OGM49447.1 hypothetical protein ABOM_001703 [Aspergillus bombycis]
MDKYSALHQETHSLTTLTSLIFQRPPDCIDYGDIGNDKPSSRKPEQGGGEELDKLSDEAEFEDEGPTSDSAAALILLKERSLDRLAEILARFKTAKTGRYGKGKRNQGNIDAKHVTSVVMVEDSTLRRVTFLCSKNGGLQNEDEVFLERLGELLSSISNGSQMNSNQSQVFDLIFEHNTPRVEYYSAALRDVFEQATKYRLPGTLAADAIKHMVPQRPEAREWEGLIVNIGGRQRKLSREILDCLSDKEMDEAVVEVCDSIQRLFGMSQPGTTQYEELQDFLKRFYAIIRNQRQRLALKNLLKQALHGSEKLFKKGWDALCFLARTFHAAVTLVELASRLKLERFNSFRFISVPASMLKTKGYPPLGKGLPLNDLIELKCRPQNNKWVAYLQDEGTIKNYTKLLRIPRSVHAEIQLMSYLESHDSKDYGQVFPYIGCSKRCCFFCETFRVLHGKFSARGTHETVFPRMGLPQDVSAAKDSEWLAPLMATFTAFLRGMLQKLLGMPYPLPHRNLCQQSSAALSTAQAKQQDEPVYSERPSILRNLMVPGAFSAADRQVQFSPVAGKPGYASFLAPSMPHVSSHLPIDQAEIYKINHDRKQCSLELIDQMPPSAILNEKLCRYCRKPAGVRCSACWTRYCSHTCQRRDWGRHVFICRIPKRPNDIDFFRLIVRHVKRAMTGDNQQTLQDSLLDLFADDYICCRFGFNNCSSMYEALYLVCLYDAVLVACCSPVRLLNEFQEAGRLGEVLELFCHLCIQQNPGQPQCDCITWYLERLRREPFPIPNTEGGGYRIWETAFVNAIDLLDLHDSYKDEWRLNAAQVDVFQLFVAIQPSIWQVPDINSSTWIKFGFCYCKSFRQCQELSVKYLLLGASSANFDDIVSAYETSTMAELMAEHGIDLSNLAQNGIRLERPSGTMYSVFRLMIGVSHALSGRFCRCFRMQQDRACHHFYETHLDTECEVGFGFDLTNSWERWQLLNFYRYLFKLPGFDARAMAAAKDSHERGALERYIGTLVPDMRRKIFDMDRAGSVLFPDLGGRIMKNPRFVTHRAQDVPTDIVAQLLCTLCGIRFGIARIRTIDEPYSAAWSAEEPEQYVCALDDYDDDGNDCGRCVTAETGCIWVVRNSQNIKYGIDQQNEPRYRFLFFEMDDDPIPTVGQTLPMGERLEEKADRIGLRRAYLEHVAGPGCRSTLGYSGATISAEEMRGCQTGQGLVHRDGDEESAPDDLECEIDSDYFLSGLVDCMGFVGTVGGNMFPARHGYDWIEPADPFNDGFEPFRAVSFHPWCFGVYMKLSRLRLGHVEIDDLVDYFDNLNCYPRQYYDEPDPAIQKADKETWVHVKGDEWLAANPFYVPRLREILERAMDTGPSFSPQDGAFATLLSFTNNKTDPFARLPREILNIIINSLPTKDIASLRLVSRHFYQLHVSLWYRLIQEDMPWLWEVWSNEKPYFWATVTVEDIKQNKGDTRVEIGEEKVLTHKIDVDEHLTKWTMPMPTPGRTNWFLLYRDIKRYWTELKGLRSRRRIWKYQEGLFASLKMHILSKDDTP